MSLPSARLGALALLLIGVGCARADESPAQPASSPMIYGDDDRVEVADEPDPILRERALRSAVALVKHIDQWTFCDPSASGYTAETLGDREKLCASEPFRDQPVLASCSGTLIGPDLVLTAAHCVGTDEACASTRFVMGLYREPSGDLRKIPRADIYACRERVATPSDHDIAIVRLDRPVTGPFEPAPVAKPPFSVGDGLMVAGFPTGIPMKVAKDCEILGHRDLDDSYLANCDLFAGNSGSGFFNLAGEVLGVYFQGGGDYKPSPEGDCFIRHAAAEDGTIEGVPTPQLGIFAPAKYAIDPMCAAGVASSLCGTSAVCGDGRCEDETPASCPADCPAPSCGDGTCDLGEDYTCAEDCGARDKVAECGAAGGGGQGGGGTTGTTSTTTSTGEGGSSNAESSSGGCSVAGDRRGCAGSGLVLVAALAVGRLRRRGRR